MAAAPTPFSVAHATADSWQGALDGCLAKLAPAPGSNIGFVYVTDQFGGDFPAILESLRQRTGIATWIGSTGIGICASGQEDFDRPAIALLTGQLPADSFRTFDTTAETVPAIAARAPGEA